jgi:hypothetical protein
LENCQKIWKKEFGKKRRSSKEEFQKGELIELKTTEVN